jgi:hypothetical protein
MTIMKQIYAFIIMPFLVFNSPIMSISHNSRDFADREILMENWMTTPKEWTVENLSEEIPLNFEDWMLNPKNMLCTDSKK